MVPFEPFSGRWTSQEVICHREARWGSRPAGGSTGELMLDLGCLSIHPLGRCRLPASAALTFGSLVVCCSREEG